MADTSQNSPAAARAGPDDGAPGGPEIETEPARLAAVLEEIGPADPAVDPGVDLRRQLVRAART